jgi:regulator of replication initiation timing
MEDQQQNTKEKNEKKWPNGGGKNSKHQHRDFRQIVGWEERIAEIETEIAKLKATPQVGSKKMKIALQNERRHLKRKIDETGTEDARRDKGFQNPRQR